MKKFLLLILLTLFFPMVASAEIIKGINYEFSHNNAQVIPYNSLSPAELLSDPAILRRKAKAPKKNYSGAINIPKYVIYKGRKYHVTSIENNAFKNCTELTSVTIPSSVQYIRSHVFEGCTGLTSIIIPEGVISIGDDSFKDCTGLTSITIPRSVTFMEGNVFAGCGNLTFIQVEEGNRVFDSRDNCNAIIRTESNTLIKGCMNTVIPQSVTGIGPSAFTHCTGLTSITIPKGVTNIGNGTFSRCSNLASIKVEPCNAVYDSRNDCNAIIETKSNTLIDGCQNSFIPEGVTCIGRNAFFDCINLDSITIPESVTHIDLMAFVRCSGLTAVSIPSGITSIGEGAFYECTSLRDVYCYAKECPPIKKIKGNFITNGSIFDDSAIASATLHVPAGSVKSYKAQAPWSRFGSISEIDEQTSALSFMHISFADALSILMYILIALMLVVLIKFMPTVLKSKKDRVLIDGIRYELDKASGTAKVLPNDYSGKFVISPHIIPKGKTNYDVTSIRHDVFMKCYNLTSLTIAKTIVDIKDLVMKDCTALVSIKVESGNPKYDSRNDCNAIIETATNALVVGCKDTVIPKDVTSIGEFAFCDCRRLVSVTIPENVTSIGECAFAGCMNLNDMICLAEQIPATHIDAFKDTPLSGITLHVPAASIKQYKATSPWNGFKDIVPIE